MSCTFFSFPNLQPSHIPILLQPSLQPSSQPSLQPSSQPPSTIFTAILTAIFEPASNFAAILPAAFTAISTVFCSKQDSCLGCRELSWNIIQDRTATLPQSFSHADHCLACSQLPRCFSTPPSLYRIKQSSLYRLRLYLRT
jgi:hypothetical protein